MKILRVSTTSGGVYEFSPEEFVLIQVPPNMQRPPGGRYTPLTDGFIAVLTKRWWLIKGTDKIEIQIENNRSNKS